MKINEKIKELFGLAKYSDEKIKVCRYGRPEVAAIAIALPGNKRFDCLPRESKRGQVLAILRIEWYSPAGYDDDPLSIVGNLMPPCMDQVINVREAVVIANANGNPDYDYLLREGGFASKAMKKARVI